MSHQPVQLPGEQLLDPRLYPPGLDYEADYERVQSSGDTSWADSYDPTAAPVERDPTAQR
jgi:hypothetical protein